MTAKQKIDKILEITELEFNDFAMTCGIIPNSLKAAIRRDALTSDIVTKIHDRFGIRKGYFKDGKEPIVEQKHTPVQKGSDNTQKPTGNPAENLFQKVVFGGTEYVIMPKSAFDGNYRLMPIEEITMHEQELERKEAELIRKDHQIIGLYELFKELARGATINLSEVKEAQKDTGT